ncbi:hypothetical protein V5O48_004670 [Marasmius crinis-equi]|uniref:Fungal-type protein kinase domain-containing protein n=1 Tax=Marasmius crinis-equi TaxID=585013 RepID=A0ABR3FPT1_9AGAR
MEGIVRPDIFLEEFMPVLDTSKTLVSYSPAGGKQRKRQVKTVEGKTKGVKKKKTNDGTSTVIKDETGEGNETTGYDLFETESFCQGITHVNSSNEWKVPGVDKPFNDDTFERRQLNTTHRTHVFSYLIHESTCRLLFWSRSGAVVTEAFNYTENDWLLQFLWRLSRDQQGIDATFTSAFDDFEARKARVACGIENDELLRKADESSRKETEYFASKPFVDCRTYLVGRSTRCYRARYRKTDDITFFNETWRLEDYEQEGCTYEKLHKAGVRNTSSEPVQGPYHRCGNPFQSGLEETHFKFQNHELRILVLDTVGYSLETFPSTWAMVNAVHHALIAHRDAVKADVTHIDISTGNILITEKDGESAGILVDWDLAKELDGKEPRSTGTWQFMSARLLEDPKLRRRPGDDLESFAYVIAWVAARHAESHMRAGYRIYFLSMFDKIRGADYGGEGKMRSFGAGSAVIKDLQFAQKPLASLLRQLWNGFHYRYEGILWEMEGEKNGGQAAQLLKDRVETHDWMEKQLASALDNAAWKRSSDRAVKYTTPQS